MPINSIQKGKDGERELANYLKAQGYDTRRGQQFCGGNGDADVVGFSNLVHIECKRVEALNIDKAYAQALADSPKNKMPVVMHRKNRQSWKVTLSLDDFIKIFSAFEKSVDNS